MVSSYLNVSTKVSTTSRLTIMCLVVFVLFSLFACLFFRGVVFVFCLFFWGSGCCCGSFVVAVLFGLPNICRKATRKEYLTAYEGPLSKPGFPNSHCCTNFCHFIAISYVRIYLSRISHPYDKVTRTIQIMSVVGYVLFQKIYCTITCVLRNIQCFLWHLSSFELESVW